MKCLNTLKDSWVSGSDFKKCSKYVSNYCARWRCQFSFLLLLLWLFFFFFGQTSVIFAVFFFCPVMNWVICNSEMTSRQELTNSVWVFNSSVNFDNFRTRESINLSFIWIKHGTARIERQNSIGAGRQKYFPVRFLISIIFLAIGCGVWVKRYVFVSVSRWFFPWMFPPEIYLS